MPVKGSSLFRSSNVIVKSDFNDISPIGLNKRAGKLPINEYAVLLYLE